MKPGHLVATKNSPLTLGFGSPSIKFKIIFQKKCQPQDIIFQFFSSLFMLGNFLYISFGIYYYGHTCTLY